MGFNSGFKGLNSKKCDHLRYLPCSVWWD